MSQKPEKPEDKMQVIDGGVAAIGGGGSGGGPATSFQRFAHDYRTELAAGTSSVIATILCYPLDSIKTRMQVYKFQGIVDCAVKTYRSEGLGAFWRGSIAPLVSVSAVRTISMSTYTNVKGIYEPILRTACGTPLEDKNAPFPLQPAVWFLSGATAGATISAIACPFEYAKVSTQIQVLIAEEARAVALERGLPVPAAPTDIQPIGTVQSARQIVKARGFLGLYTGFRYHLTRDTIGTGLYFTIYETMKRTLSGGEATVSPYVTAVSGAVCGLTSWALLYPVDTAKSKLQKASLQPEQAREPEKFNFFNKKMYRGLGVSILRSAFVNAIFFSIFERLKPMLVSKHDEDDD